MSSLVYKRYLERKAALEAAQTPRAAVPRGGGVYGEMVVKLAGHRRQLKEKQSVQGKIALKRDFLPQYADYVAGVLSAGQGAQDDVLITVMLWRYDVGDWQGASDIATYAMCHRLAMPKGWSRSLPCTVLELPVDAVKKGEAPEDRDLVVSTIATMLDLTASEDMPDEVRGKAYKVLGELMASTDPAGALAAYDAALRWWPSGAGCKTAADKLRKQLA